MSNPLSRFGNLDINDMAETRSQRARGQRGARRATSGRGRGWGGAAGQPPATSITPIRGPSGALYNTQNLSPDSNRRAAEGLAAGLYVDKLYRHERADRSDAWFGIQLKKPVSVRIYDPAFGTNRVECSCGVSNESTCCIHLYWLYDALNAALLDQPTTTVRDLTRESVIPAISGLYDLIGERMHSLPRMLNGIRGSDTDDDEEIAARKSALSDMLSVFDRQALPGEYLHDLPEVSTEMPIDQLFVPGDLSATIYGLAMLDESIYYSLETVIHRDLCTRYYLTKQRRRVRQALRDLDHYAANGPTNNIEAQGMDVEECGRTLRRIGCEIWQDHESRISKGPLQPETKTMAPEVLVEMLEGVVDRNRDIYGENLYVYLISEPPTTAQEENGDFVIDYLSNFPLQDWMHQTMNERLERIAQSVRQNAPHGRHRSISYASKIEDLLNDYIGRSDVFEPTSPLFSRQRRPTFDDERESQRPRFG